jgi:hypothetical protein
VAAIAAEFFSSNRKPEIVAEVGESTGLSGDVRLNFAASQAILVEAVSRMGRAFAKLLSRANPLGSYWQLVLGAAAQVTEALSGFLDA